MTSIRDRLLAILKEPDSVTFQNFVREPGDNRNIAAEDWCARHRLKRMCEEIAKVCSERAKHWAESDGDGSKEWAGRALISAAEADRCAAAILALGEPNEHS